MARKPGLLTSGEIEAVRLVGPRAPATKRGRPSSRAAIAAASLARRAPVTLSSVTKVLGAVVGLGDPGRGERVGGDDVGAGAEVGEMQFAHRVGLRQDQDVIVAAQVARPIGEALPAIAGLVELEPLDLGAHGAVEHQDRLRGAAAQLGLDRGRLGRFHCGHINPRSNRARSRPCRRLMPPAPKARRARRADGRWHRRGRRGSWCRNGSRSRRGRRGRAPVRRRPRRR